MLPRHISLPEQFSNWDCIFAVANTCWPPTEMRFKVQYETSTQRRITFWLIRFVCGSQFFPRSYFEMSSIGHYGLYDFNSQCTQLKATIWPQLCIHICFSHYFPLELNILEFNHIGTFDQQLTTTCIEKIEAFLCCLCFSNIIRHHLDNDDAVHFIEYTISSWHLSNVYTPTQAGTCGGISNETKTKKTNEIGIGSVKFVISDELTKHWSASNKWCTVEIEMEVGRDGKEQMEVMEIAEYKYRKEEEE